MMLINKYKFHTNAGMVVYVIATIMLNIAMLNMVISVVSDSYDRVQMTKTEQEYLTKADMLYDYATFLNMFPR